MTKYLRVGVEDTPYGAGTTLVSVPIKVTSFNKTINRNEMIEETTDSQLVNYAGVGAYGLSGSLECLLRPTQTRPLLYGLLGEFVEPDPPDGTEYYELGDPLPLVFLLGEDFNVESYEQIISGVGITSATITCEAKEFVKMSFDWVAQLSEDGDDDYALPADYATELPITFYHCSVLKDDVEITKIKSSEITIDRKLDDEQFYVSDPLLGYLVATGATDVTGTMTVGEREILAIRSAVYGDEGATTLVDNLFESFVLEYVFLDAAGDEAMRIVIDEVFFNEASDSQSGKAEAEKTLNYRGTSGIRAVYPVVV